MLHDPNSCAKFKFQLTQLVKDDPLLSRRKPCSAVFLLKNLHRTVPEARLAVAEKRAAEKEWKEYVDRSCARGATLKSNFAGQGRTCVENTRSRTVDVPFEG